MYGVVLWGGGAGSCDSSKFFPLDPLLQLQSLLCIIIFDVRSKGIANRRFTKVYEETFVLLEILYRTSYSGDSGDYKIDDQ